VEDGQIVHAAEPWTGAPVQLVLAQDRHELDAALGSFGRGIVLMEAVLLVLVAVIVRLGVGRGLAPISALAAEVDAIDEASLGRRLAVEGQPSELVGIRRKLNELLERLQMAFDRERRFSSGAAHELRTPIAELRALTEVALKWPAGSDPERTNDLAEAHAIACRMEDVVGALLAIARNGHAEESAAHEDVELRPLVDAAVASVRPIAEEKRLESRSRCPADSSSARSASRCRPWSGTSWRTRSPTRRRGAGCASPRARKATSPRSPSRTRTGRSPRRTSRTSSSRSGARTTRGRTRGTAGSALAVCETLARAIDASIRVRLDPPGHVTFTIALAREPEITRSRAPRAPARS
jgi:hypothetical protein